MKRKFITLIFLIIIFEKIVFAQNSKNIQPNETITIAEFCSLNLYKEISVKIQDELSSEKIHNLISACTGDEKGKISPIDLDLSNCTFKNKECNIFITNLKNVRSLILPKTTKIITFCLASDMETVILPDGLERIEEQAFFRTKLKSIEIPESVLHKYNKNLPEELLYHRRIQFRSGVLSNNHYRIIFFRKKIRIAFKYFCIIPFIPN